MLFLQAICIAISADIVFVCLIICTRVVYLLYKTRENYNLYKKVTVNNKIVLVCIILAFQAAFLITPEYFWGFGETLKYSTKMY